jgi:hypothetical protein
MLHYQTESYDDTLLLAPPSYCCFKIVYEIPSDFVRLFDLQRYVQLYPSVNTVSPTFLGLTRAWSFSNTEFCARALRLDCLF